MKIHSYITGQCIDMLGWLFSPDLPDCRASLEQNMPCSREAALAAIEQELAGSYLDREIELLGALKEFIAGSENSERKDRLATLATPNFHYVWEKACRNIFPHNESLHSRLPKPSWVIKGKNKSTSQNPDIMHFDGSRYYIVDAKYYDFEKNQPGWPDLVKQFYYKDTFLNESGTDIDNVMVFPARHTQKIGYAGYAQLDAGRFGKIHGVTADLITVLDLYSNYTNSNWIKTLSTVLPSSNSAV